MITFLPTPYFTPGREGAKVGDIVVHWMAGTLASTDGEFTHGSRRVSAHYGIENEVVHQYVKDTDTAWHAGDWGENLRSIGIEHSAAPGRDATPATIATSVALMVGLCRKYSIDPSHIYGHKKFTATSCPGTLPLAAMIAQVRAQLGFPVAPPPPATATINDIPTTTYHPQGGLNVNNIDLAHVTNASTTWVRGKGVFPMQRLLGIKADGIGGPQTRGSLVAYQKHAVLSPDAVFGPATATALLAGR